MLRHSTGYALANKGTDTPTLQSYLGHRSIQSTVRYTDLAPGRFKILALGLSIPSGVRRRGRARELLLQLTTGLMLAALVTGAEGPI